MVSFLVVAMPHIVPCPVPRIKLADEDLDILEDGRRRSRKENHNPDQTQEEDESLTNGQLSSSKQQRAAMRRKAHECPLPKPGGRIGSLLGVTPGSGELPRPSMVIKDRKDPKESNVK